MYSSEPYVIRRGDTVHFTTDQCDCACSQAVIVKGRGLLPLSSRLKRSPRLTNITLSDNHRVVFIPSGDGITDGLAVLNQTAWQMLTAISTPDWYPTAVEEWYAQWGNNTVEGVLGEFADLRFLYDPSAQEPIIEETTQTLVAWLHITDRCNLRCAYCYLPHKRVDMSLDTGFAAIDATFRSALIHGYQEVKLKFAGGEPLLRFNEVVKMQTYARQVAEKVGVSLHSILLSNGTLLTEEIAQALHDNDLALMISLDGVENDHDCQRFYGDGQGTFADVDRAIDQALAVGIVPDISITVSQRNVRGIPKLLEYILQKSLPFSLNFFRDNDFAANHADLQLEEDTIIKYMLEAFYVIESNLPARSLLPSLIDRANLAVPHSRTCGVGHSYLVFNHLGKVSKCQMAIHQYVTDIDIHDPLQAIRSDQTGIINLPVSEKEECNRCEWRYWCTGGCPLYTYRTSGRYDVKSPNCRIYKTLYPEAVRLEGLRLLKYGG